MPQREQVACEPFFSNALRVQTLSEIKTCPLSTRVFKETWISVI